MPVLARSKIWGNGRTTVPVEVRKVLELKDSDEIEWVLENNEIKVRRVSR